ncbi:hypothetical protein BX616_008846, partial [Lobosporangium transversale]
MSMSTTFDITDGSMGTESMGSVSISSKKGTRVWGWAIKNKWAERVETKKGAVIRCRFPGCKMEYTSSTMTTSGINSHLANKHHIRKDSHVNDGSLSRQGPLDVMFSSSPRVFDPTRFDDLLVRFVVTTKQRFAVVKSAAFQELLNHATMAAMAQVKLPSDDTMANK